MGITRDLADRVATGDFGSGDAVAISSGGSAFASIKFNLTNDYIFEDETIFLSDGKLTIVNPSTEAVFISSGTDTYTSSGMSYSLVDVKKGPLIRGKHYAEMLIGAGSYWNVGVVPGSLADTGSALYQQLYALIYGPDGRIVQGTGSGYTVLETVSTYTEGDIVGIAVDLDANTVQFYKNGTIQGSAKSFGWDHTAVGSAIGASRWSSSGSAIFTLKDASSEQTYTVEGFSQWSESASGRYAHTTNESSLNLTYVSRINSATIEHTEPANTLLKCLVSWDGRSSWEYHNGTSWQTTSLGFIETNGMTISELEAAIEGYQVTAEKSLDIAFWLKSLDEVTFPSVDSVLIQYGEPSSSLPSGALESIKFDNTAKFLMLNNTQIASGAAKLSDGAGEITDRTYDHTSTDALYYNVSATPDEAIDGNAGVWSESFTTYQITDALTMPAWWSVSYDTAFVLKEMDLRGSSWFAEIFFNIQGSNDNTNWANIKTGCTIPKDSSIYTFDMSSNMAAYKHYRVYVTSYGANNGYWGLSYVRLRGADPITLGYFSTSNESNLDLHFIDYINNLRFVYTADGSSEIKALVSFDGRQTWKKWNADTQVWEASTQANVNTEGITLSQLEGALQSYTVGLTDTYLDFTFGFNSDTINPPSIDSMVIQYTTSGVSRFEAVDILPTWTEKDEGRILYQRNIKKINFGTENGWSQLVTIPGGNYPTDGLVAEWTFDQLDGNSVIDPVNNHNGTLGSTSIIGEGLIGDAVICDGSSTGYVDIPSFVPQTALNNGVFTISCWIKPVSLATRQMFICSYDNSLRFYFETNSAGIGWGLGSGVNISTNTTLPTVNEWNHILIYYDLSNINIKVNNGETFSYARAATTYSSVKLGIGGHYNTTQYFNGSIDNVRIYNRVLSIYEMDVLYNNGLGV